MSEYDKMFGELGYRKEKTQLGDIKYYKDDENVIVFEIKEKSLYKSGEYDGMCDSISMPELKAIYEFCKDQGWLDVK